MAAYGPEARNEVSAGIGVGTEFWVRLLTIWCLEFLMEVNLLDLKPDEIPRGPRGLPPLRLHVLPLSLCRPLTSVPSQGSPRYIYSLHHHISSLPSPCPHCACSQWNAVASPRIPKTDCLHNTKFAV